MTIDKLIAAFLETQERIAIALEALVAAQGIVMGTKVPLSDEDQQELALDDDDGLDDMEDPDDDDDLDDDDDDLDDEPKPVAKKKAGKKKKTAKKKKIGKKVAEESEFTSDEVRGRLKDVQIATGSAAQAKSILKKNGASTFGQLKIGRYNEVVAECDRILDEYE